MKKNVIQDKSFQFSLAVIALYKQLQADNEYILSKQLLRSATSIGANVEEATAGISKKDFVAKLTISLKEARESRYWLKLLDESELTKIDVKEEFAKSEEIIRILTSIIKTTKENLK